MEQNAQEEWEAQEEQEERSLFYQPRQEEAGPIAQPQNTKDQDVVRRYECSVPLAPVTHYDPEIRVCVLDVPPYWAPEETSNQLDYVFPLTWDPPDVNNWVSPLGPKPEKDEEAQGKPTHLAPQPILPQSKLTHHTISKYVVQLGFKEDDRLCFLGVGTYVHFQRAIGVLTCAHIFNTHPSGLPLYVKFKDDGFIAKASMMFLDLALDYAFLKVEKVENREAAQCSSEIEGGTKLIFIGGSEEEPKWSYASGIVSADLNSEWMFGMSSGCAWGDSGAGVFSTQTGTLVGIVIAIGRLPPGKNGATLRVSSKACILAFTVIQLHIYHIVKPEIYPAVTFKITRPSPYVTKKAELEANYENNCNSDQPVVLDSYVPTPSPELDPPTPQWLKDGRFTLSADRDSGSTPPWLKTPQLPQLVLSHRLEVQFWKAKTRLLPPHLLSLMLQHRCG